MNPDQILLPLLIALGAILLGIVALAAIIVFFTNVQERRERALLDAAKQELMRGLVPGTGIASASKPLRLPVPLQIQLYRELVPVFARDELNRIGSILRRDEIVAFATDLSASRFWWRRLHGLRILTMVGEKVEPQASWFRDPHLEVRAQAAEWVAAAEQTAALPFLVEMLADPVGLCRFTVQDSLQRMRKASEEPLTAFLASRSGPEVDSALEVASTFHSSDLGTAVLMHERSSSPHTRALVAGALGGFAGERVEEALARMLHDDEAHVRAAAARSVGRLRMWTQCKRLAELLQDRSWDVRRESAMALAAVGAPGMLTLRAALKSEDRFARDMAEQALQVAALQEHA